ncbi:MAG: DUF1150 family protein [Rhodobacteraceae bacterium]|nr:DUF1150 family protein [Paracoccaceae bacterium]
MDTRYDFGPEDAARIVYVREVAVAELPDELRAQVGGADVLYAVHDVNGERLALVRDRHMAFVLARQNDLAPVSVH